MAPASWSRQLWQRYEAIHDPVYFSRQARDGAAALGLRGFWMGYFAFRMAPLGAVQPAVATALCFGFHPSRGVPGAAGRLEVRPLAAAVVAVLPPVSPVGVVWPD